MKRWKIILISLFAIVWIAVFHYASLRHFVLQPYFSKRNVTLPKLKFLYPPAGWIMFFRVSPQFGYAQVYGINSRGDIIPIDPHDIIETRTIAYDNIHRNILSHVLDSRQRRPFCGFLHRKLGNAYKHFFVAYIQYPDLIETPHLAYQKVFYECKE